MGSKRNLHLSPLRIMWAHAENRKLPGASDSPAFLPSCPSLHHSGPILFVNNFECRSSFFFRCFCLLFGSKRCPCVCVCGCAGISVCNIVFHLISALNDALTVGRSTCHACGVCNTQFSRLLSSCCLVVVVVVVVAVVGLSGRDAECGRRDSPDSVLSELSTSARTVHY